MTRDDQRSARVGPVRGRRGRTHRDSAALVRRPDGGPSHASGRRSVPESRDSSGEARDIRGEPRLRLGQGRFRQQGAVRRGSPQAVRFINYTPPPLPDPRASRRRQTPGGSGSQAVSAVVQRSAEGARLVEVDQGDRCLDNRKTVLDRLYPRPAMAIAYPRSVISKCASAAAR